MLFELLSETLSDNEAALLSDVDSDSDFAILALTERLSDKTSLEDSLNDVDIDANSEATLLAELLKLSLNDILSLIYCERLVLSESEML